MKSARWLFLLLCVATIPAAEARSFGEPFPLTNTRYRAAYGPPRLTANDRDFFLFWTGEQRIRAARIDEGEARVSHVVLDNDQDFDVAWTGTRYLLVSTRISTFNQTAVVGQLLDEEAHPIGPEFTIVADGKRPRIAVGANSIALVYDTETEVRLLLLSLKGRPEGLESRLIGPFGMDHAVTSIKDRFLVIATTAGVIRAIAFDSDGQQVATSTAAPTSPYFHISAALASNGTNALVLWSGSELVAATVDENANFGAPLVLDPSNTAHHPNAIWNGGGWTVSYKQSFYDQLPRGKVAQLDWRAQTILSREESAPGHGGATLAALGDRVLASWLPIGPNKSPVVFGLPLVSNESRVTPYVPSPQKLLATASSAGATLTVWSETIDGGRSIHAGVRNHNGDWSESELASGSDVVSTVVAASDGHEFMVALDGTRSLIRLDARGRRVGSAIALPLTPLVMAWNGTNYALFDQFRGVLVSPSGVVSALVPVPSAFDWNFLPVSLVSDGTGFFIVGEIYECPFILCYTSAIHAVRLGADLKGIDPTALRFSPDGGPSLIGVAWNGSTYSMLWKDHAGQYLSHVPASPNVGVETRKIALPITGESMTILSDGTIAVAGRDPSVDGGMSRVAFLSAAGAVLEMSGIERSADVLAKPRLELVPGGVAYIASSVQDSAPHDGTGRVVTAIAKSSNVPLPPGAPHIGVKLQNGNIVIEWTAPAGTVNGYRLEYRIDDDSWNEYEQWFSPGVQRKSIRKPSFGTRFSFRVRAFNDGGASDYSGTAVTSPSRRRAVR